MTEIKTMLLLGALTSLIFSASGNAVEGKILKCLGVHTQVSESLTVMKTSDLSKVILRFHFETIPATGDFGATRTIDKEGKNILYTINEPGSNNNGFTLELNNLDTWRNMLQLTSKEVPGFIRKNQKDYLTICQGSDADLLLLQH